MWFKPTDSSLLFTKNDKEDPRLGEGVLLAAPFITPTELTSSAYDFSIHGYADDEGIKMNGGRLGAAKAPATIRSFLYKMTPSLAFPQLPKIFDLGDLETNIPLAERHERGRKVIAQLFKNQTKTLTLGGGHDYGYADGCGFLDAFPQEAVLINFDAHLDVRPTNQGFHSGTPFRRLLEEFSGRVHFYEVGLQNQCNSAFHAAWAKEKGAHLLTMADLSQGLLPALQKSLNPLRGKKLFVSLDMDVFSSAEAPGCSQSWATGFSIRDFQPALTWLLKNFDTRGLGLYEVSPPLDQDQQTSRLAALVMHQFIFESLQFAKGTP